MADIWKSMTYECPKVMGILNVTPDSFYDGGTYSTAKDIEKRIQKMVVDGADIIDIGGYSSRPGAKDIDEQEELRRLELPLTIIKNTFPELPVSIDSFRLSVIKHIVESFGPIMINDISGGNYDNEMMQYAANNDLPYVCMHMQGNPQTMQQNPHYTNVVEEVLNFFNNKIAYAKSIRLRQCIIDPGFGFGKTVEQNYALMNQLEQFVQLGCPVLVGISRKSMIQNALHCTADEALNGTTILNTIAIAKGASIIRVHDVKEAKEVVALSNIFAHKN